MATTRQATTPKTAIKVTTPLTPQEAAQLIQDHYLFDRLYDALLERGEVSKVSDITQEIGNDRLPFAIVRYGLIASKRFVSVDRQWDLAARYLDTQKSTERIISDILERAGCPLSRITLATEMGIVFGRPSEIYLETLPKSLKETNTYFETRDGRFGLVRWVPLMDGETWEDILADNGLKAERIDKIAALVPDLKWDLKTLAEATYTVVEAMKGRPVAHKAIAALAWKQLGDTYKTKTIEHLVSCLAHPNLIWLSGGLWVTRAQANKIEAGLATRAASLKAEKSEKSEEEEEPTRASLVSFANGSTASNASALTNTDTDATPLTTAMEEKTETEAKVEIEATIKPLAISEEQIVSMAQMVAERGVAIEASELLALQYEVAPGDATYKNDLEVLEAQLKTDARFLYVGAGRFREPNSLPSFIYSLPDYLAFPELEFVSEDGEIMDEEIEEGGFIGTLRSDLNLPLAQDAGDDEGVYTGTDNSGTGLASDRVRLVVKAHHKEIGTFPLCQFPDGFLPIEPQVPITEIRVRDEEGTSYDVYINAKDRVVFNFFGLYEKIATDSGGVFTLQRTNRPYEYLFFAPEEKDPQVFLESERIGELLEIKEQIEENGRVSTFEITCSILEEYTKGLDFVQLLTQVNIVRRVTRRKLASILSNYHCFVQKAGQNLWKFDERKRNAGTDREKKRFVKR